MLFSFYLSFCACLRIIMVPDSGSIWSKSEYKSGSSGKSFFFRRLSTSLVNAGVDNDEYRNAEKHSPEAEQTAEQND